ncbi:AAA family ATPase [Allosphingosinicella vermicomposti]|uniref:AAA family ATPase n=1 Tax=Allosphingosinicella vermicomposti TaxID=614671 RepID=UPI00131A530F|nr:AAA family ATPase [Allosphingosinicella vermicomposti]
MLTEIKVASTASYTTAGARLDGLKAINFIFGTNGTGKTTISRVVDDPDGHPTCSLSWVNGKPLERLVYNRDFVARNFAPQLRGIFTLGEAEKDTLERIDRAKADVKKAEDTINQLENTLGLPDQSTGKRAEKKALREKLEADCWTKIKGKHDAHFKDAFSGLRNSQSRFCDRVLQELAQNGAALEDINTLKERASSLFEQGMERYAAIQNIDATALIEAEVEPVLAKKVLGKEDVDVAALITRLGNSDWVRQGLAYLDGAEQCPFCQQAIESDLAERLNAYFDETFLADTRQIERIEQSYGSVASTLIESLEAIVSLDSRHIDATRLRADIDRLVTRLESNKRLIAAKKREPSTPVTLEPIGGAVAALVGQIDTANAVIATHNALVDNLATERSKLIDEIWKYLLHENDALLTAYTTAKNGVESAIQSLTSQITSRRQDLDTAKGELRTLEKSITSVQPTVDGINALLSSFGFTGFRLRTTGERNHLYEIVRDDGENATDTLSEGERGFVTFLYFYHLLRGSTSEFGMSAERVVVFDDPVSSLDSDVLFIVSALIKRVLKEACENSGQIKQVFVLTHNIYFHKEVSFDSKRGVECRAHETFWIVRKSQGQSEVTSFNTNPIKTSYELLWEEVRNPNRSSLTIQNTLRRIVENYFKILGSVDTDDIIARFEGKDQQVCASLFSWVNDGSHSAHDDLYVSVDEGVVERYLDVFKHVFEKTDHKAHYDMMMRSSEAGPITMPA